MKNTLLQQVNNGKETQGSFKGPAVVFYALSIIVAFLAGGYFERLKSPLPVPAPGTTVQAHESQDMVESPVPKDTPARPVRENVAKAPSTPALITVPSATPVRIEKAIAVATLRALPSTAAASSTMAASPANAAQAGQVTMIKALEIPVKESGRIVGYINLQTGQHLTPVGVEKDQIKVKCGEHFVYVPINATDMTR